MSEQTVEATVWELVSDPGASASTRRVRAEELWTAHGAESVRLTAIASLLCLIQMSEHVDGDFAPEQPRQALLRTISSEHVEALAAAQDSWNLLAGACTSYRTGVLDPTLQERIAGIAAEHGAPAVFFLGHWGTEALARLALHAPDHFSDALERLGHQMTNLPE